MRDVAIIGCGLQQFGERWDASLADLFVDAALRAIDDAGVHRLDALYVGCMGSGLSEGQEHLGALLADRLGYGPLPAVRVEAACASGAAAVRMGVLDVASGNSDVVLIAGVEKSTDIGDPTALAGAAIDQEWEAFPGGTLAALFAMMAAAHMARHETTARQLAAVAAKNHQHGRLNPLAQFRSVVTIDDVLRSPLVATPLRQFECAAHSDGASALVLCSTDLARRLARGPVVRVAASSAATDVLALHDRPDPCDLRAVGRAARLAYDSARCGPGDIDVAEVHDVFTIAELLAIEALGFVERGDSGRAVEAGEMALGGRLPVNPSGGLKAKGHPAGASGVAQIAELVHQLRGTAGERQVPGASRALAQSLGGAGASAFVHILEVR